MDTEPFDTSGLVAFLQANRAGERYLLATSTTRLAAPIIVGSGEAVMAMGGFHGLNPILTPDKLGRGQGDPLRDGRRRAGHQPDLD